MAVRWLFPDAAWADMAPRLAAIPPTAGSPPARSARLFIEAVLDRARTGRPWQDRPRASSHWDAVDHRGRRGDARGL